MQEHRFQIFGGIKIKLNSYLNPAHIEKQYTKCNLGALRDDMDVTVD